MKIWCGWGERECCVPVVNSRNWLKRLDSDGVVASPSELSRCADSWESDEIVPTVQLAVRWTTRAVLQHLLRPCTPVPITL
jgi:hypothetical protein